MDYITRCKAVTMTIYQEAEAAKQIMKKEGKIREEYGRKKNSTRPLSPYVLFYQNFSIVKLTLENMIK